jgi:uncharacterized membrane protein YdjX (TVP38/TMEM64 family)
MKSELRSALKLLTLFAAVALALGLLVDFQASDVRRLLEASRERPELVFALAVGVLAVDSVLAVPTITTVLAAGYLLGPWWGALASFSGMMSAGSLCYWGGRAWGASRWLKGRAIGEVAGERAVGAAALLVARAAPMMPEVLSAMAGSRRMPAQRYYLYFGLGNLPFAALLAYAGSVSTVERPWPAVAAALLVPAAGAAFMTWRRFARARHCSAGS